MILVPTNFLRLPLLILLLSGILSTPQLCLADDGQSSLDNARKELLEKTGQLPDEETVKMVQRVLEKDPHNALAHMTMALCYDRLGMPDLSTQEYELSVQSEPDNPHALLDIIKSELKQGHTYTAMKLLQAACARFPKDPELIYWKANYLVATERKEEAAALYRLALAKDKKILGLACALADLQLDIRRYGDALTLAEQDLAIDPQYWPAYRIKGMALAGRGRNDLAIEPLRKAFAQMPFKSDMVITYAKACYWLGDYKEALDPALINLAIDSSMVSNNYQPKQLVLSILKMVPAQFAADRIALWRPKIDNALHNAAFHFSLGAVLDSANMPAVAIEEYEAGLKMSPNFARGIFRLGRDLELDKRQYNEAMACYTRAHMLDPGDQEITRYMIRLQQRLTTRPGDIAWEFRDWLADRKSATAKEIK